MVLVGRERPVSHLSWSQLASLGGLGDVEFWSKICLDGLWLHATTQVQTILGFSADEMIGSSLYQLARPEEAEQLGRVMAEASRGKSTSLRHSLRNRRGQYLDVFTHFYANTATSADSDDEDDSGRTLSYPVVLCQTNEYSSELRRRQRNVNRPAASTAASFPSLPSRPQYDRAMSTSSVGSLSGDYVNNSSKQGGSRLTPFPSIFKTLENSAALRPDNVFDELDTTRGTSWQCVAPSC